MARKQGCHCRQCKQCVLHFSNNLTQIKMCRKTMRAGKGAERQRRRGQEGAPCLARILGTQAMPSAGPSPGHMSRIFQRQHQLRLPACLPASCCHVSNICRYSPATHPGQLPSSPPPCCVIFSVFYLLFFLLLLLLPFLFLLELELHTCTSLAAQGQEEAPVVSSFACSVRSNEVEICQQATEVGFSNKTHTHTLAHTGTHQHRAAQLASAHYPYDP